MTPEEYAHWCDVEDSELTDDDFIVITESDMQMLAFVASATTCEVDYSAFYLDDESGVA